MVPSKEVEKQIEHYLASRAQASPKLMEIIDMELSDIGLPPPQPSPEPTTVTRRAYRIPGTITKLGLGAFSAQLVNSE
ncbi:MAG: hypothetical protein ABI670_12170 [Chloroflexota bacterium]